MADQPIGVGLDTFAKILADNARRRGQRPACREKEFGIWQSWTWAQAHDETRAIALGLIALGFQPGDRLAILGSNRPHLYWSMVAAQMAGGVPVPVYADSVAEEIQYVLEHAETRFAVVEDQEQVDKILAVQDRLPALDQILFLDPRGMRNYGHGHVKELSEAIALGRDRAADMAGLDALIDGASGGDPAVMLYTSGTTGRPKGVVLSHENLLATARAAAEVDKLGEADEVLAYLPNAWVGDFVFSMGQAYTAGFCVSCPESADTVMQDLREIGPTYYFAPPRVFEQMLTNIGIRMADAGPTKRFLYQHFMRHADRVGEAITDGRPVGALDRLWYRLGEMMIYGPLKNALGLSRVRVGYTAGEAIGPEIFRFYRSIGVNLKQLYGQTEGCVFVTQQPDGAVRPDTVGAPTPGVEIKIAENGEVLYRSPGVFLEYFKNPEATAEAKTPDGWVHTGDAGYMDPESGQLRIIDRAKDVGKLATGELFAPKYIENKLKFFPNIKEAVVFGDGRAFVAGFLNIDLDAVGAWAERNGVAYASYQELAAHPRVYEMMRSHVAEVNRSIAQDPMLSECQIRRFLVLHKELDADDGELTRTRKVRRNAITDRYGPLIEALYDGSSSIYAETDVTYEDGGSGKISATLTIAEVDTVPTRAPAQAAA